MEILLKIVATGAQQTRQALSGISQAIKDQARAVQQYNASLANGAAAWRQLASVAATFIGLQQLRESVRMAQAAEVEIAQLRRTLQAAGQASDELFSSLVRQSQELQTLTGVGDDTVLAVQRLLFTFRLSADEVMRLTPLVLDLAAATGRNAVDAARQLGAALQGRGDELLRYGIDARDAAGLIEQLSRAFAGQAAAAREALGPMAETTILWDQMRQALGRAISVPLQAFLRGANDAIRQMMTALDEADRRWPAATAALRDLAAAAGVLAGHFGAPAVGLLAVSLGLHATWRLLAPAINMMRVAFFALAGSLQAMTREMGLATAMGKQFRLMLDGTAAAAARASAALRLGGAAISGLLAALSGYELGKAIGQIEVLGRTIQDRLVDVIFRAQGGWARLLHAIGLIDADELARRLDVVRQALAPEPPEQAEATAAATPTGPAPAPELERLQHTVRWFQYMAAIARNEQSRLAALKSQLEFLREITRHQERQLDAAQKASTTADGQLVQTREFLEAERAYIEAREAELDLARQIAELERDIAKQEEARAARATMRTFRGQLGAQLADQFGFIIDAGRFDHLASAARDAAAVVSNTLGQAFRSIGDQITQLIIGTVRWGDALRNIAANIISQLVASIVQFFTALAARALLTAIMGQTILTGAAASAAAAWSGPAILASIATMGTAATLGPASVAASLAAAPAVTAAATVAGYAEGGLVPPGERLIIVGEEGPEFVVNADATRRWLPLLEAINDGMAPMSATMPGAPPAQAGGRAAAGTRLHGGAEVPGPVQTSTTRLNLVLVDSRNAAREWLLSAEGETRIMDIIRRRRMEIGL